MRTDLLLRHADFLDNLPVERFDFSEVRVEQRCGTVGCAVGWLPESLPEHVSYFKKYNVFNVRGEEFEVEEYDKVAELVFEMDNIDAIRLFSPNSQSFLDLQDLPSSATPKQVASLIRQYCEKYGDTSTEPK